ncbi:S9 family peptidase [Carboxylicivirga linearis]|uniref:S9 family peptidase n=1 Tax=Carboxylicivirga linearis TaxID=1628157 RepID=A0ABS5K1V2_9BACT|nr:S9 family peptidase [Carboxylicivirga linearis]MBS2101134.1 S9 family peptidase [Carboxylicivirga linearis]
MKKILFIYLLTLFTTLASANNKVECLQWKVSNITQLSKPAFSEFNSVDNKPFKLASLLSGAQSVKSLNTNQWSPLTINEDSVITGITNETQLIWLEGFVTSNQYAKVDFSFFANGLFEIYLDGEKVKTQSKTSEKEINTELTLYTGKHQILVKLLSTEEDLKIAASLTVKDDTDIALNWTTNSTREITIHDVIEGKYIQSARISPSGKYILISEGEVLEESGKRERSMQVFDISKNRTLYSYPGNSLTAAKWLPKSDKISYTVKKDKLADLYVLDVTTGEELLLAKGIDDLGSINWSPNEDYVIFSRSKKADKVGHHKRIFGNDDRLPYFRTRSFLYKLDLSNGVIQPLTTGFLSTSLHDIKPDGSKILFSTSSMDYTVVPFSKQTLFEMNLETLELDTIWKDKTYGGSCDYSPDGKKLLVSGSPETFGDLGVDVQNDHLPNSYDRQLYIFDLQTKEAEAITKTFDPSVGSAFWKTDNEIYLTASDKDLVKLFKYNIKSQSFTPYSLPVEVVSRIDFAKNGPMAVYNGTSISTPEKLFTINLKKGESKPIIFPKEETFNHIAFGETERWDFENKNGTNITGTVYYPKDYDASKKYPVIVYYYGGTSPTSRSFGGRYPKNIWAANGYMVYVLQPSGATGFGQSFSALHVNGWGTDAIDDIIDGTKKFLAAHPTADANNVGCIGASYGGFTTMMLQTRTNIFKTAISHAGISDISSYWGEGYWGYSYSAGATKNSYPWNRRDIYVDNSPLFNADKFNNSILLLHGTADTNVPVGESLQYYAALKILDKEVEMVLIEGEDHHILDYDKRIQWHNTIISWFDKMLKDQPAQWNELYPDKNL